MAWKDTHQGLYHASVLYHVFVVAALAYIWQLSQPPKEALSLESMAVWKRILGPGTWIQPHDLWAFQ